MAKKKLSKKNEFLNWFDGHYKKILPVDDKGMFVELCGLGITRESYKMTDQISTLVLSKEETKAKKEVRNARSKFLKECYNAFIAYICEVKGFAEKGVSREYRNWYIEMSKWYEANKAECDARIMDSVQYFSDITKTYMITMFF